MNALRFGRVFPVPDLRRALRRSFFIQENSGEIGVRELTSILHALNPRALARTDGSFRAVLFALWHELEKRFPLLPQVVYEYTHANDYDLQELAYIASVVPVSVQGIYWYETDPGDISPALCTVALFWQPQDFGDFLKHAGFAKHAPMLMEYLARVHPDDADTERYIEVRPPRGCVWRPEWAALPHLIAYACSQTGNPWLDWDNVSMDEQGYDAYPPMNLAEIRGLESHWKRAASLLARIRQLEKYIGSRTDRLELLARVLTRDRAVWTQLTAPKTGASLARVLETQHG